MSSEKIYLSAVIPVFNEKGNLAVLNGKLCSVLSALNREYEVIYVDDGSTDGSRETLKEISTCDPRVKLIFFSKNFGQTAALDAGFKASKGEFVVALDADLQNDPGDIPLLIRTMEEGGYDTVIGWRVNRRDGFIKRSSSRIANAVRNKFSGEDVADTGCSLKLFKRECLSSIKLFNGMHRFLPTLIKMEGYKVGEVKVSHHPRLHGISKYGVWNRLFRGLRDLFAVRWMKSRRLDYRIINVDGE